MTKTLQKLNPFGVAVLFDNDTDLSAIDKITFQELIAAHGLVVLRGVQSPSSEHFLKFCTSLPKYSPEPLAWDFGPIMELKYKPDAKNYLFSTEKVPFHWDGAFFKEPAILAFHCLEAPQAKGGGETIFCNTADLVEGLSPRILETCEDIRLEFLTEKVAHYGGRVCSPLVQTHPLSRRKILRLAEAVDTQLNPVTMKIVSKQPDADQRLVEKLVQLAYSKSYCYAHTWQTGDLLFADNFSLIHGRHALTEDSGRWIRRIQIMHKT